MRDHNLLRERRIKQLGVPCRNECRIAVQTSNTRWCSDGFEFRCENSAKLSVTFAPWIAVIAKPSAGSRARPGTAAMISAT